MGELLYFWLSRIAGAVLEFKLMRSDDGGHKLAFILAGLVIGVCLIAMSIYA